MWLILFIFEWLGKVPKKKLSTDAWNHLPSFFSYSEYFHRFYRNISIGLVSEYLLTFYRNISIGSISEYFLRFYLNIFIWLVSEFFRRFYQNISIGLVHHNIFFHLIWIFLLGSYQNIFSATLCASPQSIQCVLHKGTFGYG